MPHECLKELVSPTHTNLMRAVDDTPSILSAHSADHAAECEKENNYSFIHNRAQKYNFFFEYANIFAFLAHSRT